HHRHRHVIELQTCIRRGEERLADRVPGEFEIATVGRELRPADVTCGTLLSRLSRESGHRARASGNAHQDHEGNHHLAADHPPESVHAMTPILFARNSAHRICGRFLSHNHWGRSPLCFELEPDASASQTTRGICIAADREHRLAWRVESSGRTIIVRYAVT